MWLAFQTAIISAVIVANFFLHITPNPYLVGVTGVVAAKARGCRLSTRSGLPAMARNSGFGSVPCITVEARPICLLVRFACRPGL
jgi:hypothetical protein